MAKDKTIQSLKFSLRKSASKQNHVLSVKSGKKEFKLDLEVSAIQGLKLLVPLCSCHSGGLQVLR